MGFYGNITNTNRTQFQFDRVYPNRHEMEYNKANDGIYQGRYILIEYDEQAHLDTFTRVWIKDSGYHTQNDENPATLLTWGNTEENQIVYTAEVDVADNKNSLDFKQCVFYKRDAQGNASANSPATFSAISSLNSSQADIPTYTFNYNVDLATFGTSRGYDSTVWMKQFRNVNGSIIDYYVMIAELNTVVPTFAVSADAPTMSPVIPHFDTSSTDVYYELHAQPQWGFRIKEAKKTDTLGTNSTIDENVYPSDEQVSATLTTYDNKTGETKTDKSNYNGAIYYNRAGFDVTKRTHIDDSIDIITIEPTGQSGNMYNQHSGETSDLTVQPDIQELRVILPSLGNTISDIWDLIYTQDRCRDVEWKDVVTGAPNSNLGGMTRDLSTIAGCINSVHDLMGMIITNKKDEYLNLDWYNKNYIYQENEKYYRIRQYNTYKNAGFDIKLPELQDTDQEYNTSYRNLLNDLTANAYYIKNEDVYIRINKQAIPNLLASGEVIYVFDKFAYEYEEIEDFAGSLSTIHGLILQLRTLIDSENPTTRDSNTLMGLINQLNDIISLFNKLIPGEFMVVDYEGNIVSANWTTAQAISAVNEGGAEITYVARPIDDNNENRWISVSLDEKTPLIKINHEFTQVKDTETASNVNDKGDTVKLYTPIVDNMGHVVGKNIETVTLPYGYKSFTTNGFSESEEADLDGVTSEGTTADSTQDIMSINSVNKWIQLAINNDELKIAHEIHDINTTEKNKTDLDSIQEFTVQDLEFDNAGHIISNQNHTYRLPDNFKQILVNGSSTAVTASASTTGTLEADSQVDILTIGPANKWITMNADPNSDSFTIGHATAGGAETTTYNENDTPNFGSTFQVPTITYDGMGHVVKVEYHTVMIPKGSLNDLKATDSSVLTGISMVDETGAITQTNANVGTLTLTGYIVPNNGDITANDSINSAFNKLDNAMQIEEDTRAKAISNLQDQLDTEKQTREQADTNLSGRISQEMTERTNAINTVNNRINLLIGDETKLKDAFNTLEEMSIWLDANDTELRADLVASDNALGQRITNETSARETAVTNLGTRIGNEESKRASEIARVEGLITSNDTDISTLQGKLLTAEGKITQLETSLVTANNTIAELRTALETLTNNFNILKTRVDEYHPETSIT